MQQALDELTPDASAEAVNMELSRIGNNAVLTVTDDRARLAGDGETSRSRYELGECERLLARWGGRFQYPQDHAAARSLMLWHRRRCSRPPLARSVASTGLYLSPVSGRLMILAGT